jgi:hypothetical protein
MITVTLTYGHSTSFPYLAAVLSSIWYWDLGSVTAVITCSSDGSAWLGKSSADGKWCSSSVITRGGVCNNQGLCNKLELTQYQGQLLIC